jgi:hypothetical protein
MMDLNFYRYKRSLHFIFYQRWLKEGADGAFSIESLVSTTVGAKSIFSRRRKVSNFN